jgi:adenylylsulfate kinase-like enzyme
VAEGVLITGVYGSGKSSVAAEIAYLLEQRRQPYALLDLDFLGWGTVNFNEDAAGSPLMLRNLAAVASNYRDAGISTFVLAWFVAIMARCAGCGRRRACRCGWSGCRCRCPTSNAGFLSM